MSLADTKDMCKSIDALNKKHNRIVITGDFNLSYLDASGKLKLCDLVRILANELHLNQIATSLTREGALLNLIFTSPHFAGSNVTEVPPIAGSDP